MTSCIALLELRHQNRWRPCSDPGLSLKRLTVIQLWNQKDDPQHKQEQKERDNAYIRDAAGANGIGFGDLESSSLSAVPFTPAPLLSESQLVRCCEADYKSTARSRAL